MWCKGSIEACGASDVGSIPTFRFLKMENWYDEEEDVLGIHIQDKEYWKSVELPNGIIIDISREGDIIGIEV